MLPTRQAPQPAVTHQPRLRSFAQPEKPQKIRKSKPRKHKARRGWFGKKIKDMAEDIFDVVEDIFD